MIFTLFLLVILNSNYWWYLYWYFLRLLFENSYHLYHYIHFYILVLIFSSIHSVTVSFFSTSTLASFHHHQCWLIGFIIFLCFLISHECYHLLGLLITLEVLCWAIILLLFINIFLQAQRCCFTITVVDCYILKFFFDSSPRMSATSRLGRCLYCKYFAEQS